LKALAVLSPWSPRALPPLLPISGFVPEMNENSSSVGKRLAPNSKLLSIVQRNCPGSWDVFLSLFEWFKEATTYPSIVLLHEPPVSKGHHRSFNALKSFSPPVRKPRVAAYVHLSFLSLYSVLPRFKGVDDVLTLTVCS